MDYISSLTTPTFTFAPSKNTMSAQLITQSSEGKIEDDTRCVRPRLAHAFGLVPYDRTLKVPSNVRQVSIEHMMLENP